MIGIQMIVENGHSWGKPSLVGRALNNHDYIPLKRVHKTNTFFRYRIIHPNYNKYIYRIKTIQKYPLIKIILQYNK